MQPNSQLRAIFVTTWSVLTVVCFFVVLPSVGKDQSFSSGLSADWPDSTKLARPTSTGHLIVFVHPYCPCTRATLKNLDEVLDSTKLPVSIIQLRTASLESVHSPISSIASIASNNGWDLILDDEGVEANKFGATTSGECMLFDSEGALLFAGGITASRGHLGNNQGLASLKDLIEKLCSETIGQNNPLETNSLGSSKWAQFPTFGCPLFSETACGREPSACQNHAF